MNKEIKKFLGWLGIRYCPYCGGDLEFWYSHGWDDDRVYFCKKCGREY